jgi:hypothetical protein
MMRSTLTAMIAAVAITMAFTFSGGTASATSVPAVQGTPLDQSAMAAGEAAVRIEPAGYHRRYYGPRYRYPRYGYPHYYRGYYYPRMWWGVPGPVYVPPRPVYGGHCARWSNRCASRWGYRNRDYWGCMRYHGC